MQLQIVFGVLLVALSTMPLCQSVCRVKYDVTTCDELSGWSCKDYAGLNTSYVVIDVKNATRDQQFLPNCLPLGVRSLTITGALNKISFERGVFQYRSELFTSLRFLNLHENDFKKVPSCMYNELKLLNLHNNSIEQVPRKAFRKCQAEELDLSFNSIETIRRGSFTSAKENKTLKIVLSYNKIRFVEAGSFPSTLLFLNLDHNQLGALAPAVFDDVPYLIILYVRHNHLGIFQFSTFYTLQSLFLSNNRISQLSFEKYKGESLFDLFLDHNDIYELDADMFKNKSITRLDLSHNKIKEAEFLKPVLQQALPLLEISLAFNRLQTLNFGDDFVAGDGFRAYLYGNPWRCDQWLETAKFMRRIKMEQPECELTLVNDGQTPFCVGCFFHSQFFPKKLHIRCNIDETKVRYFLKSIDRRLDEKCRISKIFVSIDIKTARLA